MATGAAPVRPASVRCSPSSTRRQPPVSACRPRKIQNAAGSFVAPTQETLLAALGGMSQGAVDGVLEAAPRSTHPDAYPLTTVSYAATNPSRARRRGARGLRDVPPLFRWSGSDTGCPAWTAPGRATSHCRRRSARRPWRRPTRSRTMWHRRMTPAMAPAATATAWTVEAVTVGAPTEATPHHLDRCRRRQHRHAPAVARPRHRRPARRPPTRRHQRAFLAHARRKARDDQIRAAGIPRPRSHDCLGWARTPEGRTSAKEVMPAAIRQTRTWRARPPDERTV